MRRMIALLLAALLLLGMSACGKKSVPSLADKLDELPAVEETEKTPEKQDTPSKPAPKKKPEVQEEPEAPEEEPLHALEGTYHKPEKGSEGEETYIEIQTFPDFAVIEYFHVFEGSTYSFWVEEFWLDEDCEMESDSVLTGKSQEFSIMSKGNEYFGIPRNRTITLTKDGVILQYEDEEEEVFVLDTDGFSGHSSQSEQQEILDQMCETEYPEDVCGYWACWDGWWDCWIGLEDDGRITVISKEPGRPIHLLKGVWGVNSETNQIQIVAEMVGEGSFPYMLTWNREESDEDGLLILTEEDHFLMPEFEDGVYFWEAESEFYSSTAMVDAIGYVYPYYDLSGEYTDQYDTDYYYYYRLPQLLEEEGDMGKINAEIREFYEPIIEEQLERMEQNEFLDTDLVTWEQYVTADILTIHVYNIGYNWETHHIWYYDLITEKQVDSSVLLERVGISEEELLEKVREQARAYYIDMFSGIPEAEREQYGYYDMLDWTVSDEAVNLDLPIYIDRMGSLCVYARVGSLAGAGEIWTPLYPFEDWSGYEDAVG